MKHRQCERCGSSESKAIRVQVWRLKEEYAIDALLEAWEHRFGVFCSECLDALGVERELIRGAEVGRRCLFVIPCVHDSGRMCGGFGDPMVKQSANSEDSPGWYGAMTRHLLCCATSTNMGRAPRVQCAVIDEARGSSVEVSLSTDD